MRYKAVATAEDGAEEALFQEPKDDHIVIITFPISGWFFLKIVRSHERFVVFRLGRVIGSKGPGIVLLLPFIDHWQVVDLQTKSFNVALFEATCKDGAQIIAGAEIQYHVSNPVLSVVVVQDIRGTLVHAAKAVMVGFLLKKSLSSIKMKKSKTEKQLSLEINEKTKSWGVQIDQVNMVVYNVKFPLEALHNLPPTPPSSRPDRLPQPFRVIAGRIVNSSSSAPSASSQHVSELSSDSEEGVQIVSEKTGFEESVSDRISPDWILSTVQSLLSKELVRQFQACYLFIVNQKNGARNLYYLDLSRGSGYAGNGVPEKEPDVTLEISEKTMRSLLTGETKPLSAYMSRRIRVQGDLKLAMKLEDLIKIMQQ
ncbi:stomatin-like protein 1 isoform X2 [Hypanus sabinus]|uniref:stomatin-like protein 1 isoform X2 n=1 Tax=Hypanus sabinus TaxID=79690 RepID=UPI0028C4CF2D|nr:stomatin-like protein 1 isoform X2 [Hypanus sabinus]